MASPSNLRPKSSCARPRLLVAAQYAETRQGSDLGAQNERAITSPLQPQPPHIIALADRHAAGAQNVVGGRGVEMKVWQRERQQKSFGDERNFGVAKLKADVLAFERIHLGGL